LAGLAGEVQRLMAGGEALDAGPRPVAAAADSPLSHAQERLWFLDQLAPGNPFYNVPVVLRLRGEPRVAALAGALRRVARRHQALCTSFPAVAGRPAPRIGAGTWSRLPVVDLGGLPAAPRRAAGEALAAREAARPFDLESGPVARASLLRLGESEHLLLLTLHHIVADGWSIGVLVREVGALYRAAVLGAAPELPELPIQYADFARWQRQWLAGEVAARQLGCWRERLADLPALDLPLDRRRPAAQRFRGSRRRVTVGAETVAGLRRLGRERGATLFMSVLAGFAALLGRWSRQREVVVGSPIAGRTRPEVEGLIGVFVNSLVLRLDVCGEGGEGGFGDLVSRVREVALGAYAHQDLPFEKLVEELQPQRNPSRHPLFQVVFALQDAPVPPLALPGLELALLPLHDETAKFDLELDLREQEGELRGALRFDRDLFDGATVRRMGEQLSRLLSAAAAEPGLRPVEIPLLSPAERQMLLVEWNGLDADAADRAADPRGGGGDLVARFRRQVERTPGATAVVCDGAGWSYAELWERSLRVGARLRAMGAGPGARVGVCLERSLELVAALLGVLEAGAAYVPLDPSYPEERSLWMLGDAGVGWVLSAGALAARVRGHDAWQVVELEDGWAAGEERGGAAAGPDLDRSELPAYVIYTSGSTGRPKGVVVPHRAVARLFTSTAGWFGFSAADVWTLFHSAAFDFSVWELWGALLHGGRLVVVPYWVSRSPESFHRLLLEEGVTVLSQTPSAWVQLLARMAAAGEAPPALRWVVFGGEALEPSSLEPWWGLGSAATLVNMYGITETTVHVTYRPWREAAPGSRIGVPLPDLAVYVVSAGGGLAPLGGLGELWVGGGGPWRTATWTGRS
jgi:amino acid adenylation domain-containing protein